jgi:hypothetical protein
VTRECYVCVEAHRPPHGRKDACVRFRSASDTDRLVCVDHALAAREAFPNRPLSPLLRPLTNNVIILRDPLVNAGHSGNIIIPDSSRDWLGRMWVKKRRNDEPHLLQIEVATGIVLAAGPGCTMRKYGGGIRGPWRKTLEPMIARAGTHIVFRAAYETASTEWRGLTIIHDYDVLGEVDDLPKEGAAQ